MNLVSTDLQVSYFSNSAMTSKLYSRRGGIGSRRTYVLGLLKRRLPILGWLPTYDSDKFFSDIIAGITVGLTVMPQGLAYATLAGLEPQVRNSV